MLAVESSGGRSAAWASGLSGLRFWRLGFLGLRILGFQGVRVLGFRGCRNNSQIYPILVHLLQFYDDQPTPSF